MHWIQNLREIADRYNTYVVDVWGVLYDGNVFSPTALQALRALKEQGHAVILLSNSARSSEELRDIFDAKGLHQDQHHHLYDRFVTSGDYVQKVLQDFVSQWGHCCYFMGTLPHQKMLEKLDIQTVEHPEDADFAVLASLPTEWQELHIEPFEPFLDRMFQAGLPAICANPDLYGMQGTHKKLCAGSLADYYETRGGRVTYSGKPQPEIYRYALETITNPDASKVLCIGDSLRTDVQGAHNMGYDALWVLGGVHQEILTLQDPAERRKALDFLCQDTGCTPSYATVLFA